MLLNVLSCSFYKNPAFVHAAYKTGTACPFDKTNLSFLKSFGSFILCFNPNYEKNKIDRKSAIDEHEVGCPLLAD